MWGSDTKDHKAPVVLPEGDKVPSDSYPFFCTYYFYGLVPPFLDFFSAMMSNFWFRLLDFPSNTMTCMVVFAHLCQVLLELTPTLIYFAPSLFPTSKTSHYR